jgi:plasmid stabilization system protein ParE
MEQEKIEVVYTERAAISIAEVAWYITGKGYPETAQKYRRKLYEFGNSLVNFTNKYPLCRHTVYKSRNYRCAVFDKSWVFVYKLVKKRLIIYYVIHSSLLT